MLAIRNENRSRERGVSVYGKYLSPYGIFFFLTALEVVYYERG